MRNSYFRFKKFTVRQELCAMKVGTDGVLLGAWAPVGDADSLLDVGTGTGLVALMLAQRRSASPSAFHIDAIDIDEPATRQAQLNITDSPYSELISVRHASLQTFAADTDRRYDLIVSNPPYFDRSLKCPDPQRSMARHSDTLPLPELLNSSHRLLAPGGRIALILPHSRLAELQAATTACGLYITRTTYVIPTEGNPPKRILVELRTEAPREALSDTLVIEVTHHRYTEAFTALMRDFYLNM